MLKQEPQRKEHEGIWYKNKNDWNERNGGNYILSDVSRLNKKRKERKERMKEEWGGKKKYKGDADETK